MRRIRRDELYTQWSISLSMYPSAEAMSMPLTSDHIHLYKGAGGRAVPRANSDDVRDAPAVVRSELPNNPRGSMFFS